MTKFTTVRLCSNGCDFLIRRGKKGWDVYVRKTDRPKDERVLIGTKTSVRSAEGFADNWALLEQHRKKKGQPSQLVKKVRERVQICEEE